MKLKIGRKYITRDGQTRLLEPTKSHHHFGNAGGWVYFEDGHIWKDRSDDCEDIVAEYVELPEGIPQPPRPKDGYRWIPYLSNTVGEWLAWSGSSWKYYVCGEHALIAVEDVEDTPTTDNYELHQELHNKEMAQPNPKDTVPEGFTYYGVGPLKHFDTTRKDVARWHDGSWDSGRYCGDDRIYHYALRTGSEIHLKNMPAPTRYFVHTGNGFEDGAYITLEHDATAMHYANGVTKAKPWNANDVARFVNDGNWKEISEADALGMKNTPDPLLETTISSLEKLEAVNARLREELAQVRDDWNKDALEQKMKYDQLVETYRDWHAPIIEDGVPPTRDQIIETLRTMQDDKFRAEMEIAYLNDINSALEKDVGYFMGLLEHVAVLVGGEAFEDGRVVHAFVPEAVAKVMLELKRLKESQ